MKTSNIYRISLVFILTMGMTIFHKAHGSPPMGGVSFQVFYNELSPFGDWIADPNHGYIWVPYVDQNFHPYMSNGHWAMTNYGNTWVSYYDWGWAPFHYGRWFFNDMYGWSWVPGYEWGPAWVSWRNGGGYYGWAPLAPGYGFNVSLNILPRNYWVFIPQRRFMARNFFRYRVPVYNVVNVYNNTTIINNTHVYNDRTYYTGPNRTDIQRATRRNVPVYQVSDTGRPGRASINNNTLVVYRPEVASGRSANANARPSRVFTAEEYQQRASTPGRTSAAPSRNAQNNDATNAVRPTTPSRREAVAPTQSRTNSGAAVNHRNAQTRQASPAVRSNTNSRQASPAVRNNSNSRQSSPAVRSNSNARQTAPNVRTAPSSRQSVPAVRSAPAARQSSPAVRSSAPSRQSATTVRSSTNSSRSAGTSSRGGGRGGN